MHHKEYCQSLVFVAALLTAGTSSAEEESLTLHAELDPLPFIQGGYGIQIGFAHAALPGWRFGLGNFSLDVPDAAVQLNSDNDGFHIRVRNSRALYGLHFFSGLKGWCVGGSLRMLRQQFTHDDAAGESRSVREFSAEAIGGYKWHPLDSRFYLMPWAALAKTLHSESSVELAGKSFQPDFVQLFATMNIGVQF